mmetsp:Transcript_602/g.2206  ORF Transcript_602/g.2206 Transcript_602/m.2206 type:complete len:271 (-) Transcript_602:1570-2382(-)
MAPRAGHWRGQLSAAQWPHDAGQAEARAEAHPPHVQLAGPHASRPRAAGQPGRGAHLAHAARAVRKGRDLHGHRRHPHRGEPVQAAADLLARSHRGVPQARQQGHGAAPVPHHEHRVQQHPRAEPEPEHPGVRRVRRGEDRDHQAVPELPGRGGRLREQHRAARAVREPHPGRLWQCQDGAQRQQLPLRALHRGAAGRPAQDRGSGNQELPPGEEPRGEPGARRAELPHLLPALRGQHGRRVRPDASGALQLLGQERMLRRRRHRRPARV